MPLHSPEQGRRRYYLVSLDQTDRSSVGIAFVNRDEALVNGRMIGYHERMIPGRQQPTFVGVPPFREKPRVMVGGNGARATDYDGPMPKFVSHRAKQLLETIDPDGFEFAECETTTRRGTPIEPYWCMDVIRWVDRFDEERSDFTWYHDRFPAAANTQSFPTIFALNDIHMPEDFPGEYHAFSFAHYRNYDVFDEVIVDAWREAGMRGLQFTPLQPPTERDLKHHLGFINYPYWTNRVQAKG